jgi:hypothetical protein
MPALVEEVVSEQSFAKKVELMDFWRGNKICAGNLRGGVHGNNPAYWQSRGGKKDCLG